MFECSVWILCNAFMVIKFHLLQQLEEGEVLIQMKTYICFLLGGNLY